MCRTQITLEIAVRQAAALPVAQVHASRCCVCLFLAPFFYHEVGVCVCVGGCVECPLSVCRGAASAAETACMAAAWRALMRLCCAAAMCVRARVCVCTPTETNKDLPKLLGLSGLRHVGRAHNRKPCCNLCCSTSRLRCYWAGGWEGGMTHAGTLAAAVVTAINAAAAPCACWERGAAGV
jgi:hypothetical protein